MVLLVAGVLTIAPVTLRNYVASGEAVLVSDAGGFNFYIGNGPGANGTFRIPAEVPGATSAAAQFQLYRQVNYVNQCDPRTDRSSATN